MRVSIMALAAAATLAATADDGIIATRSGASKHRRSASMQRQPQPATAYDLARIERAKQKRARKAAAIWGRR